MDEGNPRFQFWINIFGLEKNMHLRYCTNSERFTRTSSVISCFTGFQLRIDQVKGVWKEYSECEVLRREHRNKLDRIKDKTANVL